MIHNFTGLHKNKKEVNLPDTTVCSSGSSNPLLGRTQYLFGAVVLTLNSTLLSDGLNNVKSAFETAVKGPIMHRNG